VVASLVVLSNVCGVLGSKRLGVKSARGASGDAILADDEAVEHVAGRVGAVLGQDLSVELGRGLAD